VKSYVKFSRSSPSLKFSHLSPNSSVPSKFMDSLTSTITAARRVILAVGCGDGSQQAAIIRSGHKHVISTFFDSEHLVNEKYLTARENIKYQISKSKFNGDVWG